MVKYFSFILIFTSLSCSTTGFKDFFGGSKDSSAKRNEELMKDFEVKDNVLEKFKETKVKESVSKTKNESPAPSPEKRVAPVPQKITRVRIDKRKKNIEKKQQVPTKKKSDVLPKKAFSDYPAEFDERLKSFDQISEKFWSRFKPVLFPGERTILDITYMGVSTGQITLNTNNHSMLGETEVYHLNARVKTASFYSYLYELDDYCDSYVRKDNFKPLKFSLIQRESSQDVDDLQLFDHDEFKTYSFYKRVTDEKTKKKKSVGSIPKYFQDPLSIVYFIRGLPLVIGESFEIPIVNKGKVELLVAKVEAKETIDTKIGTKPSVRISVHTRHKGETIEGGKMVFWYSDDDQKVFLRFKAKIKIGSVSGEIHSYKN